MELDEDVLEMVRRQLDREPPPSSRALYGRAVQMNNDLYDLNVRQFHAKYSLRVKRERARAEREASAPGPDEDAGRRHLFGGRDEPGNGARSGSETSRGEDVPAPAAGDGTPGAAEATRERVRDVFMALAREVAEAEGPETLVGVVERMPDRVDEIARIVRARPSGA